MNYHKASELRGVPGVQYRDIPGFIGYCVGDDGSIWSCRESRGVCQWRQRKPNRDKQGRYAITLSLGGGKYKRMCVHVLVLMAFRGPRPEGMLGCHNDDNHSNNTLENLRWDTPQANADDCLKNGGRLLGSRHQNSKLNEEQVKRIKSLPSVSRYALAAEYGVSPNTISYIRQRGGWSHVQ